MNHPTPERDHSIDILRSLGLFCIILAHIEPPNWLFQLRNFDVPLMVFISGYLYSNKQYGINSFKSLLDYLGKRFVRLVLPVWIFLSLFYGLQYLFPQLFSINYLQYPTVMLSSYLLLEGFGYVWIIRVFLMMAILGPLCVAYLRKPLQLLCYYLVYELLYQLASSYLKTPLGKLSNEFIGYAAGFLIFFILGSQYQALNKRTKTWLLGICLGISLSAWLYGYLYLDEAFNFGSFKYPPRLFYSYYALGVCLLLFQFKPLLAGWNSRLLNFVGSSSIWIYLWHILFLFILPISDWMLRLVAVLSLAILMSYLQQRLIEAIILRSRCSARVSKQLRIIFCS